MRQRIAVALLFVCTGVLAGCGGGDAASDAGAVASNSPPAASPSTSSAAPAAPATSESSEEVSSGGSMLGPAQGSSGPPGGMPGPGSSGPPGGMPGPGSSGPPGGMPAPGSSGPPGGMPAPGGYPGGGPPGGMPGPAGYPGGGPPGGMPGPGGYPGGGPPGGMPGPSGIMSGQAPPGPGGAPVTSGELTSGGGTQPTADSEPELNSGGGTSRPAGYPGSPSSSYPPGSAPGSYPSGGPPPGYPGSPTAGGGYPGLANSGRPPSGGYPGAPPGTPGIPGTTSSGYPGTGVPGTEGADNSISSGGVPGFPGTQPQAQPTTYDALADFAFQQGRERDAFQYLYAWALTSDAGAAEFLSTYQWVPGLKRPAAAVRWGVGLQITAPPNFTQSPSPIGTEQALGAKTGTRGREGGSSAPGAEGSSGFGGPVGFPGSGGEIGGSGGGSNAEVAKYAGELGDKIMTEFHARISEGKFGKVLQEAPQPGSTGSGQFGGSSEPGVSGPGISGPGIGGPPGMAPGMAPGMSGGPGPRGSFRGGPGGPPGGMPGMPGMPGMAPGMAGGAGAVSEGALAPGLTFLGTGSEKELLDRAKKNSIDVVAVFRVKLTVNRSNFIINETELVLLDGSKPGRPLFSTTTLTNVKVQQARQQNKDDGVDREVKKLFDYIDKNLTMIPLPEALTAELVKTKRVDVLAKQSYDNPLPVLAEIRFYNRNKLLSDADMVTAMGQILANEGAAKTFVDGTEEDRKKAISKWLPKT